MQRDSNDMSLQMIESSQEADTFVEENLLGSAALARLISFRCSEAHTQALPCQDYARVVSIREGASICFCVCDGVGSSYQGNFSAKYLAICLVDWLQKLTAIPKKPSKFVRALQTLLDQWAREAQNTLTCHNILPELPALVREVLEELRDTYGSETVFLCGRIDSLEQSSRTKEKLFYPSTRSFPIKALFLWMGNVTARLFISDNKHIDLGDRNDDNNRWSTVQGLRGVATLQIFGLETIERLIVYTDGFDAIGDELADLSNDELQMRIQQLLLLSTSDDMTVLDLQWMHTSSEQENKA